MKRKGLILTSILILTLSINSHAQDKAEKAWRKFEVTMTGGVSIPVGALKNWYDSVGAKSTFNFGGSGGYFFNDHICLGGYFSYVQFPIDKYDLNYKLYDVGAYAKYAFTGESNFEPYLKLKAGADFAKFATWVGPNKTQLHEISYGAGLTMAIYGGALYYTSDYSGIFLEAGYNFAKLKDIGVEYAGEDYKFRDNVGYLDIRAGITVFFGPEQ